MPFTIPRWAWFAIGGALLLLAFYLTLHAYGHAQYNAGKAAADAEWKAASEKLVDKAHKTGAKADVEAAARASDYAAKVQDEKEKIDRATEEGSSPFDVLFNAQ